MKTKWALPLAFAIAGAFFFALLSGMNISKKTTRLESDTRSAEDILYPAGVTRPGEIVSVRTLSPDCGKAPLSASIHPASEERKSATRPKRPKSFDHLTFPTGKAYLALIVDDCGYNLSMLRKLLATKLSLTVAILPNVLYSAKTAQLAAEAGVPFLVHMPMQGQGDSDTASGMLCIGMSDDIKRTFVEKTLAALPGAFGVNNHRGSRVTEDRATMDLLMEELSKRGLFFLDSRTSSRSVAYRAAYDAGLRTLKNGFFLDNSKDPNEIAARFEEAFRLAEKKGFLIAICHLRPQTVMFLETLSSGKKGKNVQLVSLPELLGEAEKQ